jgi:hypothetical protein
MNIEICKKCPKLKDKRCSIVLYEDNNEFIPVIFEDDNYYQRWLCQMKTMEAKNITIIDVNGNRIPYIDYKNDLITLYQCDCLEIMPCLNIIFTFYLNC